MKKEFYQQTPDCYPQFAASELVAGKVFGLSMESHRSFATGKVLWRWSIGGHSGEAESSEDASRQAASRLAGELVEDVLSSIPHKRVSISTSYHTHGGVVEADKDQEILKRLYWEKYVRPNGASTVEFVQVVSTKTTESGSSAYKHGSDVFGQGGVMWARHVWDLNVPDVPEELKEIVVKLLELLPSLAF